MDPGGCNLGKDDAEMLKPPSPSPSPSSAPPPSNHCLSSTSSQPPSQQYPSCPSVGYLDAAQSQRSERPATVEVDSMLKLEEASQLRLRFGNRCLTCRKKVSLSGFRCRCGDLFCAQHRYSDTHDCSFDYKAAGREEISKANPLVRAAKIIKI